VVEVPGNIRYDHLSAIKHLVKGKAKGLAFIAFRSRYLFQSCFSNPSEASEKGLAKSLVGGCHRYCNTGLNRQSW